MGSKDFRSKEEFVDVEVGYKYIAGGVSPSGPTGAGFKFLLEEGGGRSGEVFETIHGSGDGVGVGFCSVLGPTGTMAKSLPC